jgi:acetyl-CoA acetyltransferase
MLIVKHVTNLDETKFIQSSQQPIKFDSPAFS